jgi:hypothetical protein
MGLSAACAIAAELGLVRQFRWSGGVALPRNFRLDTANFKPFRGFGE